MTFFAAGFKLQIGLGVFFFDCLLHFIELVVDEFRFRVILEVGILRLPGLPLYEDYMMQMQVIGFNCKLLQVATKYLMRINMARSRVVQE